MSESGLDVVTGAFSFTGRYIAEQLLARGRRVRTLAPATGPSHPLAAKVEAAPFVFDSATRSHRACAGRTRSTTRTGSASSAWRRPSRAVEGYGGSWLPRVRPAPGGSSTSAWPIPISSPFPYYRAGAQTEDVVRESRLSYASFGRRSSSVPTTSSVNNASRGVSATYRSFLVQRGGARGAARVRSRHGCDLHRCRRTGPGRRADAAGPSRWTFDGIVRLIAHAVGSRAWITRAPEAVAQYAAQLAGLALRDVLVTRMLNCRRSPRAARVRRSRAVATGSKNGSPRTPRTSVAATRPS